MKPICGCFVPYSCAVAFERVLHVVSTRHTLDRATHVQESMLPSFGKAAVHQSNE